MNTLTLFFQVVLALSVLNVWLLRHGKPTRWRPDGAANMVDEFRRYGFPDWFRKLVGTAKLTLAMLLIAGIRFPVLAAVAATAMALLMLGAVGAHIRVRDPLYKSIPAFSLLVLSLLVARAAI